MTAERCGIGSLIPVGCRGRAEAFARRLQSRLRTLGRGEGGEEEGATGEEQLLGWGDEGESSSSGGWRTSREVHNKQPIVSPDSAPDRFFDFDMQDESGPGSPLTEEIGVNHHDGLSRSHCHCQYTCDNDKLTKCQCAESGCFISSPQSVTAEVEDSSSEDGLQYYEPAWDVLLAPSDSDSGSQNSTINHHHHQSDHLIDPAEINNDLSDQTDSDSIGYQLLNNDQIHENKTESITNDSINNDSINNDDSTQLNKSLKEKEEIRECVERLCSEIISQAEIEVASINKTSNESSPKVIISRAESGDYEENIIIKDKDEINTLFECLNVTHDQNSDSSQISTPDEEHPRRVQRSSSLKTGKTPPSTPGRKKIVRFADVLGLDLADVRTYLDEIPKVPSSAFWDLEVEKKSEAPVAPTKCLVPMFQQPVSSPDFLDKVRCNKVCLENAFQSDSLSITGVIRVLNMDFHKSVYLRYSLDSWQNFADLQCSYVPGSSDGFSDKFSFVLYAHTLDVGQKVEFAAKYTTAGQLFWDSNGGVNYAFQCLNSTVSNVQSTSSEQFSVHTLSPENDGWASFY